MSNYTLASKLAIVKKIADGHWLEVDVSSSKVMDLFAAYKNIYLSIKDLFGKEHTLSLYDYEFELTDVRLTISEWLATITDTALTLTDGYPKLTLGGSSYVPGCRYFGDYALSKENTHPSQDVPLDDCTDLIVRYHGVDMPRLNTTSLWSCNGYYLRSHFSNDYIRIPFAGEIIKKSSKIEYGFLNFEDIGKVTTIPITKDMVFKVDDRLDFGHKVHIHTGVKLYNKTVGLVIGGYLHLLDEYLTITSDRDVALTLNRMSLINRILASKDSLDLSFMQLDEINACANVKRVVNPELLIEYLTCKYSFIVLIDNPEVFKDHIHLDTNAALGTCLSPVSVVPNRMVDELGGAIDYWYTEECGQRCMQYSRTEHNNYLFNQTHWKTDTLINDARNSQTRTHAIKPYFIQYTAKV